MKGNSDSENEVMPVKKNDDENIIGKSVIEKTKESERLTVDEINEIIERCNEKKKSNPQADIIDENFLRLVWSFNLSHYENKNKKDKSGFLDYNDLSSNLLFDLFFHCADEFFHCLYLLDIGFEDLAPVVQKRIKNDDYKKEWSDKYPNQYNIIHKPWRESIASKMFYNPEKPLDVGFFVWLNKNGYFAKHQGNIGEYHGQVYNTYNSGDSVAISEFESICENRKKDRIGNYKFKTFDEFKSFVNFDLDNDRYYRFGAEHCTKIAVSVKSLLDVLKKENKSLTSDEFIKLVKRENIFFDKPENLTEGDIEEWNDYKDFVNKSGMMGEKEKTQRREARKKLWEYIKCILFGNSGKNTRGLLDIKNLNDDELNKIANCLSDKFEFFTGIQLFCDDEDIFNNRDSKYKQYIADDLKIYRGLFLTAQKNVILPGLEQTIELDSDQQKVKTDLSQQKAKMVKIVVGIILLLIGIIGCGTILGLGLTDKLAIISLLFFITMTAIGFVCLIWKKISRCLVPCCPSLSGPSTQKKSLEKNKNRERDRNLNLESNEKNKIKIE